MDISRTLSCRIGGSKTEGEIGFSGGISCAAVYSADLSAAQVKTAMGCNAEEVEDLKEGQCPPGYTMFKGMCYKVRTGKHTDLIFEETFSTVFFIARQKMTSSYLIEEIYVYCWKYPLPFVDFFFNSRRAHQVPPSPMLRSLA